MTVSIVPQYSNYHEFIFPFQKLPAKLYLDLKLSIFIRKEEISLCPCDILLQSLGISF